MACNEKWLVRRARPADASDIASIYSEAILARNSTMILDPVSSQEMAAKINALAKRESILVAIPNQMESVAVGSDKVVGWGIVKYYSDRPGYDKACETSLFVDASHRGNGMGLLLQTELLKQAQIDGFHHVLVRIWAQNKGSIALHEKLGFTLVGIQKEIGHVNQQWIDVAVMQCLI